MRRDTPGQTIGVQMITAADGTAFTGAVSVFVTVDGGTQAAGGTVTHEGNGYHSYTPTQAETNGDHVAFTFTGTGAIPATVQVYTTFPQTADVGAGVDVVSWAGSSGAVKVGAGSGLPEMDTLALNGSQQSAADLQDFADAGYDPATNQVNGVKLVDTTTTNTDMRGTDGANTDKTGYSLAADQSGVTVGTVNNVTNDVSVDMTQSVPEGYSTAAGVPTLSQILHEINQTAADFSISGTTLTVNRINGTAAMTFTLDSATDPTSRTRAT